MIRILSLALSVIICSGCSITTPAELRADHALHSQLEVTDSLQTVVKNISNKANECGTPLSENIAVLEELGEGRIEYRNHNNVIVMLVDLRRHNDKTRVTIYSRFKVFGWEKSFRTLEYGAKNLPGCP